MGAQTNTVVRSGKQRIMRLAEWALAIVGVALFFIGQPAAGSVLVFAALVVLLMEAASIRSQPVQSPTDGLDRAESLLHEGEYAAAARAAEEGLRGNPDDLMRPFLLLVSAVALAASGKSDRARRAVAGLEAVPLEDSASGYEPGVVFQQITRTVITHLDAGVPDPEALVAEYLRLSDVMFT